MTVKDAVALWIPEHAKYVKPKTLQCHREMQKPVTQFFGSLLLREVTIDHVRQYQDARKRGDKERTLATKPIGHVRINQELILLSQVLKEARMWSPIQELYQPLPINHRGSGRAASPEDEAKLLAIAFSRSRWRLPAHCLLIMFRSGCGFG